MAATIFAVLVCAAMHTTNALAQSSQANGPLTKNGLMKMLLLNDSSQKDLIQLVTKRGVDSRPTPELPWCHAGQRSNESIAD
jgi:hypothetical protein